MGDLAGRTSQDQTSQSETTNQQIGASDQALLAHAQGQSQVQVGGTRIQTPGNVRDFTVVQQSSDPALVEHVLLGGAQLVKDIVKQTQETGAANLTLTAGALNASAEREAKLEATRINPEDASQKNILIAVGIGGAVLLFTALHRK